MLSTVMVYSDIIGQSAIPFLGWVMLVNGMMCKVYEVWSCR